MFEAGNRLLKKLLVLTAISILIVYLFTAIPVAFCNGEELIDSQTDENASHNIDTLHPSSTVYKSALGHIWTCTGNYQLTKMEFCTEREGSPGFCKAVLYSVVDGEPDAVLASSDLQNASEIPTDFGWFNFTFSGDQQYEMVNGNYYGLVVQSHNGSWEYNVDYLTLFSILSDVKEGNYTLYKYSEWQFYDNRDLTFRIYGIPYSPVLNIYGSVEQIFGVNSDLDKSVTKTFEGSVNQVVIPSASSNFSEPEDLPGNYTPIEYTGYEPVFECAMNNMFELNGVLEGNDTYRQMLLDTSPYENHGKIYPLTHPYAGPSLTWGRTGKALQFDGVDDSVIVANSDSLNFSEAFTIEFWFNVYDGVNEQAFISKHNGATGQWIIGINNHTLYTELWTTSGTKYANYTGNAVTCDIEDGVFYYFCLTYDYRDGNYTVYLHGQEQYSVATDGNKTRNVDVNLYLGNLGNSSQWFEGILDEVRIFPYKRSLGQIYSDARQAITHFDSWSFVNSGNSTDGETWDTIEGISEGYMGFLGNDPELPWTYSNDTRKMNFVRSLDYVAGFQSYQFYCNVRFNTSDNYWDMSYDDAPEPNHVRWYWNFFKNGRLQVTYDITFGPYTWGSSGYGHGNWVSQWIIVFRRSTPYFGSEELVSSVINITETEDYFCPNPSIVVSAWIGSDNKHFSVRFDFQDQRTVDHCDLEFPYTYSFDLVDENLNVHMVDWFDGWVVSGTHVKCWSKDAGTWAKMEIESHKLAVTTVLIAMVIIVGAVAAINYVIQYGQPLLQGFEQVKETVANLIDIPEIVGTAVRTVGDTVADALAGLSHDFIGAVSQLGTIFGQALRPVTDLLSNIGEMIAGAFITYMEPLITAAINIAQNIGAMLVDTIDSVFGWFGFEGAFSNFLTFLGSLWNWLGNSITWLVSFLTSVFSFLGAVIAKILNTLSTVVTQWVSMLQNIFSMLDSGYGYATGIWETLNLAMWVMIIAILYPIYLLYLWEKKGLDAAIGHVKMVLDVFAWIGSMLLTVIQLFITLISNLIEHIPVIE